MKLKSLLFVCCLSLLSTAFAENRHLHPQAKTKDVTAGVKNAMYPGFCEIEIINSSNDDIYVTGQFDDGSYLSPFYVYRGGVPQYISLYYYGYCHDGMGLTIESAFSHRVIYSNYTRVNDTVRIVPYLNAQLKAEVHSK